VLQFDARVGGGTFGSAPSFLDGGFGKLLDGDRPGVEQQGAGLAEGRVAVDWEPSLGWRLFLHGVARHDSSARDASSGSGLLEAYVEWRRGYGSGGELVARGGQFFFPGSFENVGRLWSSPYTLTLSALNSWVAEEIRPIGVDLGWRHLLAGDRRLTLAATAFEGNDTSGALLAWRGFSFHDRPTPTGRWIPLPPLPSLATTFAAQSPRGTRPFGRDLDGRPGWAGRARLEAPARHGAIQASIFRNRGDRELHDGEYALDTDFRWLGVERDFGRFHLAGEWGSGTSAMGPRTPGERGRAKVDIRFESFYLLASRRLGRARATLRYDRFLVEDRDSTAGDDNREHGHAWTLALLTPFGERWRLGLEVLRMIAQRPAAAIAGSPRLDADALRAELRVSL